MRSFLSSFVFLAVLLSCLPTHAEETQFYAIISQEGVWDSNPLNRTTNVKDLYGSSTAATLKAKKESDTTNADVSLTTKQGLFDDSSFNSTDFYAAANLDHKAEKWHVGFDGRFAYDTTRTSEVTNAGLNIGSVRHMNYRATPKVSYVISRVSRVSLEGTVETSRYDSSSYTDSTTYSLKPSYTRRLSPLTDGIFSFKASRYKADETNGSKVTNLSPSLGFSSQLTPTMSWSGHVGAQASKQTGGSVTQSKWRWYHVYGTNFTFDSESDQVTLSASRERTSQSNGSYDLITNLSFNGKHTINKTLSASAFLRYQMADYEQEVAGEKDTKWSGSFGLSYKISPSVDLKSHYQYDYETLTKQSDKIRRHRAMLTLAYHPYLGSVSW